MEGPRARGNLAPTVFPLFLAAPSTHPADMFRRLALRILVLGSVWFSAHAEIRIATFDVDATPPPGSLLMYDPFKGTGELSLRCRGLILTGSGEPIVLCAVDWIGIGNEGHDAFRDTLAAAAGTTRARVAVHSLHQHDAPVCDYTAERLLLSRGLDAGTFDSAWTRPTLERASNAVRVAITNTVPVTHVGWGQAEVKEVASNRRIPGPDGKIKAVRYTACPDPALRAEPEGIIDPKVSLVSFWDGDRPLVILSYYATHPQSFYRTGIANPDFPGIARFLRDQAVPGVRHVHFDGAGGNIGAGKYNDGSPTNRAVLAGRLADGLQRAWAATQRQPLTDRDVGWQVEAVRLPNGKHLNATAIAAQLGAATPSRNLNVAKLAWLEQSAKRPIDISCLRLGTIRILHLPGELFVEYQLAAQRMRPDLRVAMAAYGDYGPSYIGTAVSYGEGGYETSPDSSFVAPEVEAVLTDAMKLLLQAP